MTMITGKTLVDWGFKSGKWFKDALPKARDMADRGFDEAAIRAALQADFERVDVKHLSMRDDGPDVRMNIHAETEADHPNIEAVEAHLREIARVPTVKAVAAMPDACPAGTKLGVIPVGGVVATENAIHPTMHSADICCSVAITVIGDVDPKAVLDAAHESTHFGPGGRKDGEPPAALIKEFADNPLLADLTDDARFHFATQGDGNHFLFVGRLASSGDVALVTHHGSRRPGAQLYKKGRAIAEQNRRKLARDVPKMHAWITADSEDGHTYWAAMQTIRSWTKSNHEAIHDMVLGRIGEDGMRRFWNEHNFVFERDGLFYHGKGATPAWTDFADDSSGQCLIPLNMSEPVLIVEGTDADHALGFCLHGAGRNFGRKAFLRTLEVPEEQFLAEQTEGLDVRFYCGHADLSELPAAYKSAAQVRAQIDHYELARVVDEVVPYGSIMAGDWEVDAPWRKGK